jgi:hypothetical protein
MKKLTLIPFALVLALAACGEKKPASGPAENAGQKVDEAAKDTKQATSDAAEDTKDAAKQAGQGTSNAVQDAKKDDKK